MGWFGESEEERKERERKERKERDKKLKGGATVVAALGIGLLGLLLSQDQGEIKKERKETSTGSI